MKVDTPGQNEKFYAFGALDYFTNERNCLLSDSKKSKDFLEFLRFLFGHYSYARKIYLVLDNYAIPKTGMIEEYLNSLNGRMELVFLPTYSPHLNPMETEWRVMRQTTLNNYLFENIEEQKNNVMEFFNGKSIEELSEGKK